MIKRVVSIILICSIVLLSFSSCSVQVKNDDIDECSIMDNAEIIGKLKGQTPVEGEYIEIKFSEPRNFNTVVIKEVDEQVFYFEIYVEDYEVEVKREHPYYVYPEFMVYQQDKIGEYRYCDIGNHYADSLTIRIVSSNENHHNIKDIDVLNIQNYNEDFRVTSYIVCSTFYANEEYEEDKLNSITDLILFGIARFDENGSVYLQDVDINGKIISGDEIFNTIIDGIRKVNPKIKIHCNALGPDGTDTDNKELLHSQAFIDNGDKLVTNILDLIEKYNFDGFFFDYEYPYKLKSRMDFSKFIVKLDENMDDYILGAALSGWNCKLSKKAINALDRVEIMAYDDMSGQTHSDFDSEGGGLAMLEFEKQGYDLSKCDLGLPFYGRTHNGDEAWPSYAQIAPDLNDNLNINRIDKSYLNNETNGSIYTSFNGVQLIRDKTAFAHDYGVGGVFSWHYSCDVFYESELSLFRAIQTALGSRG